MDIQLQNQLPNNRQCNLLPVELFKTTNSYYVFDANNVDFLEVTEEVYKIISILQSTAKSLEELLNAFPEYSPQVIRKAIADIKEIQGEGYLVPTDFKRSNPYTMSDIKKSLSSDLRSLYLNITSKCNLSCSYCAFGGDYSNLNHLQHQEMPWNTARRAIDFFLNRATKDGDLRIDFFGGEPLIAFPLIQRITDTIKKELQGRKQSLKLVIATNGTILNKEIINFLIENNVTLQVSLDGEKEIHDAKRRFRSNNKGSFDRVLKNLQAIHDRDINYFLQKVYLKAVITTDSIDSEGADFFKLPLVKALNDKDHFSMINQTPHYHLEEDKDFFARLHKAAKILLKKKGATSIRELLDGLNFKQRHLFFLTFFDFFCIQVVNRLTFGKDEEIPYGKDCMIGIEGCVNVDGSISICYKSNSFIIGNVEENKWYFDKIEKFHKKRYAHSGKCKSCFVRRFCRLCYETISGKEGKTSESIKNFCEFNRQYHRTIFQYMLEIMDKNPGLWDALQKMAEKESESLLKKYANFSKL